jgi:protease I
MVRHFADANKPMASICNGLQVYMEAGVIEGKTCIGYPHLEKDASRAGGDWAQVKVERGVTEERAFVDGNLVTAAVWGCLTPMLAEFLKLLGTRIEP